MLALRPRFAGLLAVAALVLGGCASGPDVRTDYDRSADLGKYRTIGFVAQSGTDNGDARSLVTRFLMSDLKDRIHVIESTPAPTEESSIEPPPILHFNIGNALSRLGRWQEAVASFEACVRKRPEFSYAYNNLALAYWRSGKVEEARAALAKAEELGFAVNPNFKADLMK